MEYGQCARCERRFEHPNQYKFDPPYATEDEPSARICRGQCRNTDQEKLEAWKRWTDA